VDAVPQFDQVWGLVCDEEGNAITRMGRVEPLGLWFCFAFQTYDKVSLTSYLTPVDTKGVRRTDQEPYAAWPQPCVPTLATQNLRGGAFHPAHEPDSCVFTC
jgi:hypothetical protein